MRATPLLRLRPTTLQKLHTTSRLRAGQDLPPVAGYEPVQYKRNLPAKGFRPMYVFLGMGLISAYGIYAHGIGVREWNELGREKMWARIHLIPLLQAEDDRDQVRRYYADQAREKELLGANTKVYNSDKFVRPWYSLAPAKDQKTGEGAEPKEEK